MLQTSSSELQICSHKAWHVASIILSLGRPTLPTDLAERCVFFCSSPEFVEFLCWLPHSPLSLTDNGLVTLSRVAIVACGRFLANSVRGVEIGGWTVPRSLEGDAITRCFRMRTMSGEFVAPFMERSSRLRFVGDQENGDEVPVIGWTTGAHRNAIQPRSLASLRADSILWEELSNKGNHFLSCMGGEKSCQLKLLEFPSVRHTVEDHDDNVMIQMEIGHDIPEMNNKDLNLLSDTIEVDAYNYNNLHKENRSVSKIKLVEKKKGTEIFSLSADEKPATHYSQRKPSAKTIQLQQDVSTSKHKYLSRPSTSRQADEDASKGRNSKGPKKVTLKHNAKPVLEKKNITIPEKSKSSRFNSSKDHLDTKTLPKFHLYDVEGEEGSGGYGTVYRARRKADGIKFAIKYPHRNANKYHVDNERKMLERFGGSNFVIKFEGSCRSEDSDCFVLEHVEHDRPDVLKKDIDISELQWYGYCLFTALASLHKLGVIHRDVKPGNFLFSRKTSVGYIIDFNLAKDLHQKQANTGNSIKSNPKAIKPVSPSKRRKILDTRSPGLDPGESSKAYNAKEFKALRKKTLNANHMKPLAGQGSDGSGLTSAKDPTRNRIPSAERFREPLPSHGRKELIHLAQEAMQSPKAGVPAVKRKRIAAPHENISRKLVHYTPMPIYSSGEEKVQKEGPCVGTKGFRAPEVLLRSSHQGLKLDVWSAGVTLLYLIIGKLPFTGDPEQNMKDIVKLRGSEELWELAKIHNRESSFPKELYDARFLQAMELRDFCKGNTRKPEFLKVIPRSLFDLVDRCLNVNPRLRISAEDALRHEFFAPCFNSTRKGDFSSSGSIVSG